MWPDDPELRDAALRLYGATWEHLPGGIERARAWGSDWFAVSTPFLVRSGDEILAHAGVVTCELSEGGRPVRVAAVHGVCVHPEHRGKGLGRRVLEEALEHVDRTGETTAILWSEKVDLYRKFGFEPVPESVFLGKAPRGEPCRARRLDLGTSRDLELLRSALRTRQPTSRGLAAADSGWHFLIDLALWEEAAELLISLPEHEAVAVCEVDGDKLRLYDVLGSRLPPCAALVGAVEGLTGAHIGRLEVYFTPDLLDVRLRPAPHPIEDVLMVRGEPLAAPPFALSPLTRT